MRKPPTTKLATPTGLARIDFSEGSLVDNGYSLDDLCRSMPGGETGDVGVCFYNFSLEGVSSWFLTGDSACRLELEELGMRFDTIFNEDLSKHEPLEYGTPLFLCFSGMPMGWSWALYMAQEIISHQCLLALGASPEQLIKDKTIAPRVSPGRNPIGVYVDNVHIFGQWREKPERPCGR